MGTNISVTKVSPSRTKKKMVKNYRETKCYLKQLCCLNETNHFSFYESKRISKSCCHEFYLRPVGGRSTRQSKGLSLQFPSSLTLWPDTPVINSSIALLSPVTVT